MPVCLSGPLNKPLKEVLLGTGKAGNALWRGVGIRRAGWSQTGGSQVVCFRALWPFPMPREGAKGQTEQHLRIQGTPSQADGSPARLFTWL